MHSIYTLLAVRNHPNHITSESAVVISYSVEKHRCSCDNCNFITRMLIHNVLYTSILFLLNGNSPVAGTDKRALRSVQSFCLFLYLWGVLFKNLNDATLASLGNPRNMQFQAAITENLQRYRDSEKNFVRTILQGFPKIWGLATELLHNIVLIVNCAVCHTFKKWNIDYM